MTNPVSKGFGPALAWKRPIKMISMKLSTYTNIVGPTYSLDMSFMSASLYSGYFTERVTDLKLTDRRMLGIVGIVFMSLLSWKMSFCRMSSAFIIDWRFGSTCSCKGTLCTLKLLYVSEQYFTSPAVKEQVVPRKVCVRVCSNDKEATSG